MRIFNAFSINMLPGDCSVTFEKINPPYGDHELSSCIGHADTARIVGNLLGIDMPMNRQTVTLEKGETVIVAQYTGPRLPEGATELPE